MAANNEDEEEDYMSMVLADTAVPVKESSIQRRARKEREGLERGRIKSKKEKEADAEAAREKSLHTAIDSSNKGFKMMAKLGYKPGSTLGKSDDARREPIHLEVKEDRGGVGMDSEKKRKIREAHEANHDAAKKVKAGEDDYRERMRAQREEARLEGQILGAQKVLEKLEAEDETHDTRSGQQDCDRNGPDEEDDGDHPPESTPRSQKPIKSINVLWRGLLRQRLEREHEARLRHELKQFNSEQDPYANDASPSDPTMPLMDDLDEEDTELEEFDKLPATERLEKLVLYLREHYMYCFWCKHRYSENMDECPGTTEEDHD